MDPPTMSSSPNNTVLNDMDELTPLDIEYKQLKRKMKEITEVPY
jgi:hypothetical protein